MLPAFKKRTLATPAVSTVFGMRDAGNSTEIAFSRVRLLPFAGFVL